MAGQSGAADPKFVEQLRVQFGLDKPLPEQLWLYLDGILHGDLGESHRQQRTVASLIAERLPATLLLTGTAFLFALVTGVALGAAAARRGGRWADSAITVLALGFYATPIFWVGLMLVLVFSVWLNCCRRSGWGRWGGAARVGGGVGRRAVPGAAVADAGAVLHGGVRRLTRASMLEVADQDFVKTARAKGCRKGASCGGTCCGTRCCR